MGYGEESCRLYQEMQDNYKENIPPHTPDYCPLDIKSPNMQKLFPIGFMGNPNSVESQKLICLYESELKKFWNVYKKAAPLEFFLECICEEHK